jgi:ribosome biogenesis GTPase
MFEKLGYTEKIKNQNPKTSTDSLARVVAVHKERYVVHDGEKNLQAEITGNLRFTAQKSSDLPLVGDWVKCMPMDENSVIITSLLERFSLLERQAVGRTGERQAIAANLDYAFVVMALGQDYNLHRLDRYVALCTTGKVQPIVLLTKSDLLVDHEVEAKKEEVQKRYPSTPVFALSIEKEASLLQLKESMQPSLTYCFMGSSGVGKSTIINYLFGEELMLTKEVSSSNLKGRHTTTHRELFLLPNGSIVIDTPGMREVGITGELGGIESAFDLISQLSENCRFADCTHVSESGCAVIEGVENGELSLDEYEHYLKLKREQEHFATSEHEKRQQGKHFGKMVREVKAHKKKYKY